MGYAVAIATFRELGQDALRMRNAMAHLALGHHLVFLLMAGCAEELAVFCRAGLQKVVGGVMAGRTLRIVNIVRIAYLTRHMHLMAGYTILLCLAFLVGLMALGTIRNQAMGRMAF